MEGRKGLAVRDLQIHAEDIPRERSENITLYFRRGRKWKTSLPQRQNFRKLSKLWGALLLSGKQGPEALSAMFETVDNSETWERQTPM